MTWGTLSKFSKSTPDHTRLPLPRVGHMQSWRLSEICDIVEPKSNIFWQFKDSVLNENFFFAHQFISFLGATGLLQNEEDCVVIRGNPSSWRKMQISIHSPWPSPPCPWLPTCGARAKNSAIGVNLHVCYQAPVSNIFFLLNLSFSCKNLFFSIVWYLN
jgi:hypothetical protein